MDTVSPDTIETHKRDKWIRQNSYRSAEFLQAILDQAADAYCLHDSDGNILDINQATCDLLGYSRKEMLGLNIRTLAEFDEALARACLEYNAGSMPQTHDGVFKHKDGRLIPVELRLSQIMVDDEVYLISYARDVTQRKEMDKDLQLTKFAVDNAATATFWYKADDTRFFYVNDAACEYLGYSREELLKMSVTDINPNTTKEILRSHIELLRELPSVLIEGEHQKKNGDMVPIEALVKLINYDGEEYIISFVRDVTRRNESEQQLKLAKEKAERADRIKSEFLANMSHEIRTPLTGIIGFSEELKNPDLSEEERKEMVDVIINSSHHLGIIINDILDLSKIEAHQLKVENVAVSPMEMFSEIEALMSRRAREKGLVFFSDISFPLPKMITTDPVRLKQILLNICSNAIKFTDKGEIRFGIRYSSVTRQLTFSVQDTGIGMTDEEIRNIFKPFSQADASTTRRFGGTGLGLSISSELAKLLGGDIRCKSVKGVGTTFYVNCSVGNIHNVEMEYSHTIPDAPRVKASNLQPELKGRVLLAEDIDENQRLMAMYLRRAGAEVEIVADGQQAVDAAIDGNFDLILMDSQMPVMDGLSAIKQLRGQGYKKPIVSVTANAMAQDKEICLAAGADGYLKKPLELSEFYRVVSQFLKGESSSDSAFQVYDENDPELKELKKSFVKTMPEYLVKLKQLSEQKDWEQLAVVLHKLKGLGGSFGYPAVSRFSADLERKLQAKKYDTTLNGVNGLIQMCEVILETVE